MGTTLTAGVHVLLIWLFATRLGTVEPPSTDEAAADGGGSPLVVDLAAPTPLPAVAAVPQPSPAPTSPVDLTVATELPPPEWTVSRIPLAAAPMLAAPPALAAAAAGEAGGAGGGVYDPFAGAALPPRSQWGGLQLDDQAVEGVRRAFAQRHGSLRGAVLLKLRVSGAGVVLDVQVAGGPIPPDAAEWLRRALLRRAIFRGAAPGDQQVDLPISLG